MSHTLSQTNTVAIRSYSWRMITTLNLDCSLMTNLSLVWDLVDLDVASVHDFELDMISVRDLWFRARLDYNLPLYNILIKCMAQPKIACDLDLKFSPQSEICLLKQILILTLSCLAFALLPFQLFQLELRWIQKRSEVVSTSEFHLMSIYSQVLKPKLVWKMKIADLVSEPEFVFDSDMNVNTRLQSIMTKSLDFWKSTCTLQYQSCHRLSKQDWFWSH